MPTKEAAHQRDGRYMERIRYLVAMFIHVNAIRNQRFETESVERDFVDTELNRRRNSRKANSIGCTEY